LPNAGAEYDASITGGIIKITLKKRRDDGMDGSAGVWCSFAPNDKDVSVFSPFFSMNYRINKLSLYAQLNYNNYRQVERLTEEVDMRTTDSNRKSNFSIPQTINMGQARIGGIYDLSDRQSLGLEVNYNNRLIKNINSSTLMDITDGNKTDVIGYYDGKYTNDNYSTSANYLLRLDSLGSMFKILLDYFHNQTDSKQNYNAEYSGYVNFDSIYRSDMFTTNNTYAVTADLSHYFNEQTVLSGGVKYARNEMNNDILYENQEGTDWNKLEAYSSINSFSENISAIYGLFSSHIQKVSYSLGLRGEYTQASPWTNKTSETKTQEYFYLFPSVNVMLPLNNGKHSLVATYKRTIQRPTFNDLNPFRVPASEYLYIAGNPKLQPALSNDASVSLNLFYKYNLTAGITSTKGAFGRVRITDPDAPGVIIQTTDNISRNTTWYLAINGSVNPTKWWQMYINMTGKRNSIDVLGDKYSINIFSGYMNNTFTLPKDFRLDISGFYQSPLLEGNIKMKLENPEVNLTLRKQFLKNRLTASLFVNNIFDIGNDIIEVNEADFKQVLYDKDRFRTIGLSLSYNFQSGKKIQEKKVETGAAEEKARMQ